MRKYLLVLIPLFAASCSELIGERGNGERITEKITVDEFDQVEVAGAFDVTLSPSESNEVVIEVDENLLRYIEVSVFSDKLTIDTDRRLDSREGIKILIPVKNLRTLSSSGASDIITDGPISSDEIKIELSGAGNLDLELDAEVVSLDISGAASVELKGAAKSLSISMSGAGTLDAGELETENCLIQISGVGNALVNTSGTLDASVSGLGKVEYIGNPQSVKGDVSGVGDVSKIE